MRVSSAIREFSPTRFWLGILQMAGAGFALALLVFSGLSMATIVATATTTALALASFVWHRRRGDSRRSAGPGH